AQQIACLVEDQPIRERAIAEVEIEAMENAAGIILRGRKFEHGAIVETSAGLGRTENVASAIQNHSRKSLCSVAAAEKRVQDFLRPRPVALRRELIHDSLPSRAARVSRSIQIASRVKGQVAVRRLPIGSAGEAVQHSLSPCRAIEAELVHDTGVLASAAACGSVKISCAIRSESGVRT